MKVLNVNDLILTSREIIPPHKGFVSKRILLESDGMGYTLTNTFIPKGPAQKWRYLNHKETCYCISGKGILTDLETMESFNIEKDSVYILDKNDAHTFEAVEDVTLICIFNPPLKGDEIHDENFSYPLEVENV